MGHGLRLEGIKLEKSLQEEKGINVTFDKGVRRKVSFIFGGRSIPSTLLLFDLFGSSFYSISLCSQSTNEPAIEDIGNQVLRDGSDGYVLHIAWIANAVDRRVSGSEALSEIVEGKSVDREAEIYIGYIGPLGDIGTHC